MAIDTGIRSLSNPQARPINRIVSAQLKVRGTLYKTSAHVNLIPTPMDHYTVKTIHSLPFRQPFLLFPRRWTLNLTYRLKHRLSYSVWNNNNKFDSLRQTIRKRKSGVSNRKQFDEDFLFFLFFFHFRLTTFNSALIIRNRTWLRK